MSLLTEFAKLLGAGGEVVLALSVGLIAWYLIKALSGAQTAGAVVGSGVRMLAFTFGVLATGIWRNWWEPDFQKLINDVVGFVEAVVRYGTDLLGRVLDLGMIT